MSKHYGTPDGIDGYVQATCPFYKGASRKDRTITCEGTQRGTSVRTTFLHDRKCLQWDKKMQEHCCSAWETCRHARLMIQLYAEGELK